MQHQRVFSEHEKYQIQLGFPDWIHSHEFEIKWETVTEVPKGKDLEKAIMKFFAQATSRFACIVNP